MGTTFQQLVAEVTGIVPGYSVFLARRDLNKAYRDILNRRTWSFLIKTGGFNAPALIQDGSVAVTQNSKFVVADVTAAAALNAVVAGTPPLTMYQFRVSSAGGIYDIVSWDNATRTLELSRPVLETSGSTSAYMVYQCYFPGPPESLQSDGHRDFNRWISVMDPINGWTLKDNYGKAWLDVRDPQRSTTDLAYRYVDYQPDSLGNMFFEFWPHPTSGQEYVVLYKAAGLAFTSGSTDLPTVIPDALIIDRCLYKYVYRWCQINAGRNPAWTKTNWSVMIKQGHDQWLLDLQAAVLEDENLSLQAIVGPSQGRGWPPIDSNFLQSHSSGLESWGK